MQNKKRTLIAILAIAGQQFIGAAFVLGECSSFFDKPYGVDILQAT